MLYDDLSLHATLPPGMWVVSKVGYINKKTSQQKSQLIV